MKRIISQIRNGIAGQWTQPVWLGELRYIVPTCTGLPLEYGSYTTALARAAVNGGLGCTRSGGQALSRGWEGQAKRGWRRKGKTRKLEKELIFVVEGREWRCLEGSWTQLISASSLNGLKTEKLRWESGKPERESHTIQGQKKQELHGELTQTWAEGDGSWEMHGQAKHDSVVIETEKKTHGNPKMTTSNVREGR